MRWISADALETWADTQIGRAEVARLAGRLIWATSSTLRSFRFPSGEAGQIPGFDGHLIAEPSFVHPFIPGGESVWEFGTDKDYVRKANDEYEHRTSNPGLVDLSQCSFVFVTPRVWKSQKLTLVDWEKQRQKECKWKNVLALDAVKLEHWLEQHAPVAKDFAREITGLARVDGVRSVREFWEEYAERFDPKVIEQVVLCARDSESDELIARLVSGTPQAIKLQADSRDEVVAFAAAAIRSADPSVREFLEAHALILDTREAVAQTIIAPGMVFLPRDSAVDVAGSLSCRAPTLIPLARMDTSARSLVRPSWYELSQALKNMVSEEERAERLARECGRSVTILARRIPRVERPTPPWSSSPSLLAALIAGAWDDSFESDKSVLATLSNRRYEDFEREIRPLLSHPEPLEREGSVWKVRAPVDTFVELGSLITSQDMDRLRSVAATVFGEVDPSLDLPAADRPYAAIQGKKLRHSDWLRDGLSTTLLQIAVLHSEARLQVTGITPQSFVDELIADLPGLKEDARLLISLGRQLPWLIEAAPRPLLAALEQLLEGDGARILPIFEEGDPFLSVSYHTHILWGLETLAWEPRLLNRVARDLAALARLDPGGRLSNRPIASLIGIFRPWMPQTKASLLQRLDAIEYVIEKEPQVGWDLVLNLLPARHGFATPSPRPRLRDIGAGTEERLTNGIVYQTYREVVSRALRLAQGDAGRVLTLLKAMDAFRQDEMDRVCDEVERLVPLVRDQERLRFWTGLRDVASSHAAHQQAQWAFPPAIVNRLRAAGQRLDPTDPVLRVQWLFDRHFPDIDQGIGSDRAVAVDEARSVAIRDLHAQMGDIGVAQLACRAKFPGLVGASVADLFMDAAAFDRMITVAYSVADIPDLFVMALSGLAHHKFATDWYGRVAERARTGLTPQQVATLLLGWGDERSAWDLAEALGPEVARSYWSRRTAWPIRGDLADQERAAREFLKADRALAAVQALGEATNVLPAELVFEMLDGAIEEIARLPAQIDGNLAYEIGSIFDRLAARQDVSETDLARREYLYLPILEHNNSTLTLHRLLVKDPAFFVSVLCDVFRPASGPAREPTAERKGRARQGYALLSGLALVPGFGNQNQADPAALYRWVREVRRLAAEQDRAQIGDQFIGQVLSHSPFDPSDSGWPHQVIRDLIEELRSEEVERGIGTGRFNMGGAHTIDPKFPAALEHQQAAEARAWARIANRWPRTEAMLNSMAEHWESFAGAIEQRHRQDAMRD